jgi:hypothetical protein
VGPLSLLLKLVHGIGKAGDISDLDMRGKQLRFELHQLYSSMARNKTLRVTPFSNDIKNFVVRHIPAGISFDDAERILRSAGFDVLERPGIDDPEASHGVFAALLLHRRLLSRCDVMISMRPNSLGDYSTVKEIQASLVVTHL